MSTKRDPYNHFHERVHVLHIQPEKLHVHNPVVYL